LFQLVWTPVFTGVTAFYETVKSDEFVKSRQLDGTVKSARCKARESLFMKRTNVFGLRFEAHGKKSNFFVK
jgi:hypothetical protein